MPFIVEAEELKKVARLVTGLKDTSPKAQKDFYWNGVHRVVAENDQFRLLTTDGSFFLDWHIPVEDGLNGEEFDLAIPAVQFNEMVSYASTAHSFELEYLPSSERLVFHQGQRTLRLEATPTSPYPPYPTAPTVVGSPSWSTDAQTLSKQLSFMAPIIDATNTNAARSVATLSSSGVLTGGQPRRLAVVTGLASPPSSMNLKQQSAKILAAFLDALTGFVDVTDILGPGGSGSLLFATPDSLRGLFIGNEPSPFPYLLGKLESEEHEMWKIDRKTWLHGTNIVHAVQPRGTNGLTLRIKGDGQSSSMMISSSNNPVLASHDEFGIYRQPINGRGGPGSGRRVETTLAINADSVRESLQAMKGETMTVKHYSKRKILMIQDAAAANEPVRSIFLTVSPSTTNATCTDLTPLDQVAEDAQDGSIDTALNPPASEVPEPAPTAKPGDQVERSTEEEALTEGEAASTAEGEEESTGEPEQATTPRNDGAMEAPTTNSNQEETRKSRRTPSGHTAPRTDSRSGD